MCVPLNLALQDFGYCGLASTIAANARTRGDSIEGGAGSISPLFLILLLSCALAGCVNAINQRLGEMDGETDHVHLVIVYPPKLSISALINNLKP